MTDAIERAVPRGLADEPIEARREAEIVRQREIEEGLMRRHVAIASDERALAAAKFAILMRAGPALAAKLRGD